jgi:hypothetical protein
LAIGVLGLALALSFAGCSDDADDGGDAPYTPPRDAGGGTGGGGTGGTGGTGGGDDAGSEGDDGGIGEPVFGECDFNDPVPPEGTEEPMGTGFDTPNDFFVERVLTTWEGTCDNPVLRIEMSEGRCPNGTGHGAILLLEANKILDHTINTGLNAVGPDTNGKGISVRYVRGRRDPPEGEWGNCGAPLANPDAGVDSGGVPPAEFGFIIIWGELSLEAGAELVGRLTFKDTLPDCKDPTNVQAGLSGAFRVTLQRGLEDVCP